MMNSSLENEERCRRLRFKGMYIDVEPDLNVPNTSDGFCWCSHTQPCLGPDSEPVDQEFCILGRGCFEGMQAHKVSGVKEALI